jgi:uncharacterized surface protein with fasciclin (FAS1) repeats
MHTGEIDMQSDTGYRVVQFILSMTRAMIALFVGFGMAISMGARAATGSTADSATQPGDMPSEQVALADLVATATGAGTFTTLIAAVKAGGLVDTLKSTGPYTVFAPNDEAFAKLWPNTLENLLLPENRSKLEALLLYHVVPGRIDTTLLVGNMKLETLQGGSVTVVQMDGQPIKVDNANVISADIQASNGLIHVIDQVMLPRLPSS